jgi:Zn-finger nucleic acid-binding protein
MPGLLSFCPPAPIDHPTHRPRTNMDHRRKHGVRASCRVDRSQTLIPHPPARNAARSTVARIHNGAHAGGRYTRENHVPAAGAAATASRIALAKTGIMSRRPGDLMTHLHATITDPVACVSCTYNLAGLDVDGRCPECGTAISASHPLCPRCHEVSAAPVALLRIEESSRAYWCCPVCGGLGFDPGQLARTISSRPVTVDADPTLPAVHVVEHQAPISCGRCRAPSTSFSIDAATVIDRCERCRMVWVDRSELPALVQYIRRIIGVRDIPPRLEDLLENPAAMRGAVQGRERLHDGSIGAAELILTILAAVFGP